MCGGRSKKKKLKQQQQKNNKPKQTHNKPEAPCLSELLPLAAIPRVKGHPSTNVNRPGSQMDRAFPFANAFILEILQDPCL